MKQLVCVLALAISCVVPAATSAVSISGIVLYTTDDFGDPNGYRTHDGQLQAQLWRTAVGGEWHILGVWSGLPPRSLGGPPLNGPDLMVEIPLNDGENELTLLGQPGSNTRVDDYERFAINLYFDGVLDHPGLSVLFPRHNSPNGSPTAPNRSERIYSLGLDQVNFPPQTTYDDGFVIVSVTAASFLSPDDFNTDVDLVSAHRLGRSGEDDPNASDFIGVLKIMVEPSQSLGGDPAYGVGVPGAGIIPRGIAGGGTLHGPDIPIAGARPRLVEQPGLGGSQGAAADDGRDSRASDVVIAGGDAPPTDEAAETTTPAETVTPNGTPTPAKTPSPNAIDSLSPTVNAAATKTPPVTGSPAATGTPATPTPAVSPTPPTKPRLPGHP